MTTHLIAQQATIRTLDTNFLNINQKVTTVKWNPSKKHPDIFLLNTAETAKLVNGKSGEKAVLSNITYIPGMTIDTVKYCIHQGSVIHVGIATTARDLTTLAPSTNLASMKFNVTHDTTLTMSLSRTLVSSGPDVYSSKLMFVYKGITTYLDVTGYTGQIMFPWLSDDTNGTGFSVSLARVTVMRTFVRENGDIVFTTIDEGGVSRPIVFETGSSATIFDNLELTGPLLSRGDLILDTGVVTSADVSVPIGLLNVAKSDGLYVDSDTGRVSVSNGLTLNNPLQPSLPSTAQQGTLWWNYTNNNLYVYKNGGWAMIQTVSP